MKIILFSLLAITITACKGTNNKTSGPMHMPFEQKSYLIISHLDDSSILREKLLNIKLNRLLKQSINQKIEDNEEFKFRRESYQRNINDIASFEKMKSSSAEIVVSYEDRTEIYFVPAGILRDQALVDLKLKAEPESVLSWGIETPAILSKGQAYYLLSSSKEDLLKNDVKFTMTKFDPEADTQKVYTFSRYQRITFNFQFDYYVKETNFKEISGGPMRSCKSEMREAGMCEPCMAQIETSTSRLVKSNWSLDSFGLVVLIDGKEYSVGNFKPRLTESGKLSFSINLNQLANGNEVKVQFVEPRIAAVLKPVSAFNYTGFCRATGGIKETLELTPVVHMTYQMDVYGRNLKL